MATNTIAACGQCRPCRAGERSLCEHRRILGMDAPGAYAEYVVWPEDSLPGLPDGLSYEAGALAEPLAVALHGVNMARIQPGDAVFIAGGGPIGVLVHLLVRLAGAGQIIVSDLHPARLASARAFGADVVVDAGARIRSPSRASDGWLGRRRLDRGRRCRRDRTADDRRRAQLGHGGVARQQRRSHRDRHAGGRHAQPHVRGSYGMTGEEFERALELLAGGRLPVGEIVNRYATLDEGPGLFEELLASPATIKCVLRP